MRDLLRREARGLEAGEIADGTGLAVSEANRALWQRAWRGETTCSSLRVLRQAIRSGFRAEQAAVAPPAAGGGRSGRRGLFRRWQGGAALAGRWRALSAGMAEPADPIAEEERSRERARLLLDRYGVLFRELLAAEQPGRRGKVLLRPD